MRKNDIIRTIGIRALHLNPEFSTGIVLDRLGTFFKGCRTITKMQHRIELNGGYEKVSEIIASPDKHWISRTK